MKLRRLASFAAASAVIIGLLGQSASMVLAVGANTQFWQGNGTTNGEIDNSDCEQDSSAHQLWIWTGTGTNVQINVDGEVVDGVQQGQGAYHFATGWHDIGDLTSGDGGNVFVTYDGSVDGNAVVTLSHGCEGTTTTTTSSSSSTTTGSSSTTTTTESSSSSTTTTTESSSSSTTTTTTTVPTTTTTSSTTTTTVPTTTTTSFSQTVSATTDVAGPTEPNTATFETSGPAGTNSSVWMLIVALGVLLGSVVILTPASSKTKR